MTLRINEQEGTIERGHAVFAVVAENDLEAHVLAATQAHDNWPTKEGWLEANLIVMAVVEFNKLPTISVETLFKSQEQKDILYGTRR